MKNTTPSKLEKMLKCKTENIPYYMRFYPHLYQQAGARLATAHANMERARKKVDYYVGALDQKIRSDPNIKITETVVRSNIHADKKYQRLYDEKIAAGESYDKAFEMKETLRQWRQAQEIRMNAVKLFNTD